MKYNLTYNEDECYIISEILDRILTSAVMNDDDNKCIDALANVLKDATVMTISNREESQYE